MEEIQLSFYYLLLLPSCSFLQIYHSKTLVDGGCSTEKISANDPPPSETLAGRTDPITIVSVYD